MSGVTLATAGRDICIFPGLLPDECIWSYLVRVIFLNRGRRTHSALQLVGNMGSHWSSGPLFPTWMQKLRSTMPHVFGSMSSLAMDHTIFPLLSWALHPSELGEVLKRFEAGTGQTPALLTLGVLTKYPRFCAACAEEDRARYGVAYWRRTHQLGLVTFCAEHSTALVAGCGFCLHVNLVRSDHPLPAEKCVCGRPHASLVSRALDPHRHLFLGMSCVAAAMMRTTEPETSRTAGTRALHEYLESKGFVHRGKPSAERFARHLTDTGVMGGLERLGLVGSRLGAVRSLIEGRRSEYLGLRVALIAEIYGGVAGYVEACGSSQPPALPTRPRPAAIRQARANLLSMADRLGIRSRNIVGKRTAAKLLRTVSGGPGPSVQIASR